MSDWTTRLPYAHRYITKTLFEGAAADLDPPEKTTSIELVCDMRRTHMRPLAYSRCPTTVYLKRIKRYYFEVPVTGGVQGSKSCEWLAIGYTGPPAAILYANDGGILTNTHQNGGHVAIPYGAGDIVGCGYEFPSRFFFTKNGIYLGHCIAHLGLDALRPEMRTRAFTADCPQLINLGQQPFMFDIEGYFDKRVARSRELTASLPMEILEHILQFALLPQDINHLLHFSRVCRRWHTLIFRSVIDLLSIVTHKDLEDLLKILRTKTPIHARSVTTQESPDEIWLHRFFASTLPYIRSTSTLSIQTLMHNQRTTPSVQRERFLGKAPSFLSQSVPGLLRCTFTEVHTLELSGYSFSTWTRFAQVVFALQRLETLVCSSVTWDTSPTTPPTWLTFSKRLRHASFEDMGDQCMAGSLWLLLAGRPRQPSDDPALIPSDISIIEQLASLLLTPSFTPPRNQDFAFSRDYIIYDQKQDQPRSCSLLLMRQSQPWADTELSFQFEGNGVTYQATRICAHLYSDWRAFSEPDNSTLQEIGRCSTALSSANLCHFRFALSDLGSTSHEGTIQRRRIAKAMLRQHSAGLLECTWNGEAIEDTEGVQWLGAGAAASVTFGIEKTYKRGASGHVTWDVDALRPYFYDSEDDACNSDSSSSSGLGVALELDSSDSILTSSYSVPPKSVRDDARKLIPWVKLYKDDNQGSGTFIADVAFDINAYSGQAEFWLPDSAAPGRYFLAVGDYIYRTESFEIVE